MSNRILIITAVAHDLEALTSALANTHDGPFDVEHAGTAGAGVARIHLGGIDAILADLNLPDIQGIACFDRIHAAAGHIPILTLSELDDEADAVEAVRRGAQGWLSKGYFENYLVPQSMRNIIERVKVEQTLYMAQARAQITLDSIGDAVVSADLHGQVDYLNIAAEHLTGWSRKDACGSPAATVLDIVDGTSGRSLGNPIEDVLHGDRPSVPTGEAVLVGRHGKRTVIEDSAAPIHDWNGDLVGAVMVFRDLSDKMTLTSKLRHQAQHDALTDLPNRLLLNDRITQAIGLARRGTTHPVLLYLDLDRFKHINDSLGHAVGDQLLQAVAARLVECVRASDTVSRHGGDEFVVLLADERRPSDAALAAEKILAALAQPFVIGEQTLHTAASIGISAFPLDGIDAAALIKNADTAMYHAKERGRNNYQFFQHDMNTRAAERQLLEINLRRALERGEFALHYQPKIDLKTNLISGVEALLRWAHPEWGQVPPARFVPVAEECGLIVPIGRWVLREACLQAARWRQAGFAGTTIAVNVSTLEFRHREFFEHAFEIFESTGVDPADLQLELTESVLMRDVVASAAVLEKFKTIGVRIAVDDFGTGYSSLSYLSQFPIDVLKIDQSFVRSIDAASDRNRAIVSAVIGMGRTLRQRVVAEGVEHEAQLDFLRLEECNEAQGYLFSRPLDAAHMEAMLGAGAWH